MYEVEYYSDSHGKSDVSEWLTALNEKSKTDKNSHIQLKQFAHALELLKTNGLSIGRPFVDKIDGEIFELIAGNNRVLFFACVEKKFVLLHHFRKKTRTTPRNQTRRAIREYDDWVERR